MANRRIRKGAPVFCPVPTVMPCALRGSGGIDVIPCCDYSDYMIKSLRESKAHLSALVEQVARGEEVVITVRGKPKARLVPIPQPKSARPDAWGHRLQEARATYTARVKNSSGEIIDSLRGDRL
jgi:prevent-host-death family protein